MQPPATNSYVDFCLTLSLGHLGLSLLFVLMTKAIFATMFQTIDSYSCFKFNEIRVPSPSAIHQK